jgi:hypothetical protein
MRLIVLVLGLLILAVAVQAREIPEAVRAYDRATQNRNIEAYLALFTADMVMIDVGRDFDTLPSGGKYELLNLVKSDEKQALIHLRFTPRGWSGPEPDALYGFQMEGSRVRSMELQYK